MPPRTRKPTTKPIRKLDALLAAEYGRHLPGKRTRDPVAVLVATILSQNTTAANSSRAFANLRRRFPTWDDVIRATDQHVASAIRVGGLANIKAPRIRKVLRSIRAAHPGFDLSHLQQMDVRQAADYLRQFDGVGHKTAACVLLFALQMPAFPVDTHVLRVSKRLGLVPQSCSADQAHDILFNLVPDDIKLQLHLNMVAHGRARCRPTNPRCKDCAVREHCLYLNRRGNS